MRHRVRVENPHPQSQAAAVLLTRRLQEEERAQWVSFRAAYLEKVRVQHGHLWCHYCGQGGLVAELPDDATKADLRRLATLDHVVPRSHGGAEYDEGNVVVACHPCNQRKADMRWVPFWFEGNLWFRMVDSPKDWAELLDLYVKSGTGMARLMDAKECVRGPMDRDLPPKFGFAMECNGKRTLGQFFEENGMPGVIMVREEKEVTG